MSFISESRAKPAAKIKVVGVGGGGTNAVNTMIRANIEGVDFIAANTDIQSLQSSLAPHKVQIGKELTKGLGAGSDPDVGRDAALEDRHELHEHLAGADMIFVTAGMGGGTGTGGAAVVSQIARESGALTVGVVTKPFRFEGKRRQKHAEIGIERLKEHVDTLIIVPNERLLSFATPDLSMLDAFKFADNVLVNAVRGISDIINVPGTVNVDFADVKTIMSGMGHALMGIGYARGEGRAKEAARQAIQSPLLEDVDIEGATGILINITGSQNLTLIEVNEACSVIEDAAHEDANIIFGAVIDDSLQDEIRITVIATGFPTNEETEFYRHDLRPSARSRFGAYSRASVIDHRDFSFTARKREMREQQEYSAQQQNLHYEEKRQSPAPQSSVAPMVKVPAVDKTQLASDFELPQPAVFSFPEEVEHKAFVEEALPSVGLIEEQGRLSAEIDRKIEEALDLSERIQAINNDDDQLDIPTFLRKSTLDAEYPA